MRRLLALLVPALVVVAALLVFPSEERSVGGNAGEDRVDHVTDGDTLWLTGLGKVRLIGVDTPEVYGEVECYGREASDFAKRLLRPGRRVRYELGVEERDRYGRALVYVWLDGGRFVNRMLVAQGYATPLTIPPNVEYAELFVRAARRARRAARGLWGRPGCGSFA